MPQIDIDRNMIGDGDSESEANNNANKTLTVAFDIVAGGVSNASVPLDLAFSFAMVAGGVSGADAELDLPTNADEAKISTSDTLTAQLLTLEEYLSVLDIWNMAFTQLGVATVSATTDTVPQAVIASSNWDLFKEQFLGDHAWNGAKKTAVCSRFQNSDSSDVQPVDRWSFAYEVPTDYVRSLRLNGKENRPQAKHWTGYGLWEEEILENDVSTKKRCIVTDESEANLEYIFLVSDSDILLLSALTRTSLAYSFAAFLAGKFGKSPAEKRELEILARDAQSKARRADSSIGTKLNPPNPNLLWSRM